MVEPRRPPLDGIPAAILAAADYETMASQFIAPTTFAYLAGGSGADRTLAWNRAAFDRLRLMPRAFSELATASTACTLFGRTRPHPLLLAPVAYQGLVHRAAEVDTARGAAAMDTTMVLSALATRPLEDVAAAATAGWWCQLWPGLDRADTEARVRRAERAGCTAVVVTVDAAAQVPSRRALAAGFVLAPGLASDPPPIVTPRGSIFDRYRQAAIGRDALGRLRDATTRPLLAKGILHVADALLCRELGLDGIVVSNHGGRTVDGVMASLDALPGVRSAVGNDYTVLFDGGIRSGEDVLKALAAGADAVLIGRLQIYALAVAGALGVAHMLKCLCEELALSMAVTGCAHPHAARAARLLASNPGEG